MVKKRKRPEPDTADNEESQQPAAPLPNGTHSGEAPQSEALPAPEAQLGSTTDDLVSLHRARFVPWQPTAVVASATSSDGSLVAVAHESGAIEVWETSSWTCRQVMQSLNALVFSQLCYIGESPLRKQGSVVLLLAGKRMHGAQQYPMPFKHVICQAKSWGQPQCYDGCSAASRELP